jgi:dCTP deaminase
MILSGLEIEKRIKQGDIEITPFDKEFMNPNSYNLRLYNKLWVYRDFPLDMKMKKSQDLNTREIEIPESGYVIEPGILYLGRTFEHTVTKNLVPMIQGRSSIARLGIYIHITAGFGDIGFNGYWTLEIECIHPVRIYPMTKFCQIYYHTVEGDYFIYNGRYQNNKGIQPSLLYQDFKQDNQ